MLKHSAQHFGILGGILRRGDGDTKGGVSGMSLHGSEKIRRFLSQGRSLPEIATAIANYVSTIINREVNRAGMENKPSCPKYGI